MMSSRSHATRTTRAPSPGFRRPQRVIRQIAPSSRGVPLPIAGVAQPGRTTQVFPFSFTVVRRRSWGSAALRRFTPAIRVDTPHLLLHGGLRAHRCARRFDISAGPGPRAVRASASAPIDFRRGDRSPVGVTRSAKAIGRGCEWLRLLGFDSRLRSTSPAHVRPAR